jgi:hypothetical protein
MKKKTESTRSELSSRKIALESQLLATEPALMQDYLDACEALNAIVLRRSSKYSTYRSAIEAIEAYLDGEKKFTEQKVITQALLDGGYAPLEKKRKANLWDAFNYHTQNSKRRRLVKVGTKVGRASWSEQSEERS